MANIVKILLYRGEEKLACLLTAYYEIALDREMIRAALNSKNYEWLQYVYAFGKNFVGPGNAPAARRNAARA
jgi:hypothetical protein